MCHVRFHTNMMREQEDEHKGGGKMLRIMVMVVMKVAITLK